MAKKIRIDPNHFPSDKHIYDLIMSGRVSLRKVQELLRSKGVILSNREMPVIAEHLCSLILDSQELDSLLEHTNVRENRVKTATVEISGKGVKIEDIYEALGSFQVAATAPDERVRIEGGLATPDFDKEASKIVLDQNFKKFDFSKTTLLQEEDHNFSVSIENDGTDTFKMTYSTSNPGSEIFFEQLKDGVRKAIKQKSTTDLYFDEIIFSEIPRQHINKFFYEVINDRKIGLTLSHVSKLSLTQDGTAVEMEDEADDDVEVSDESDKSSEPLTVLKNMRLEGTNLLSHQSVKDHVDKGYVIKSLTAEFYTTNSASSRAYHDISLGFGGADRFVSELHKTRISISTETKMEARHLPKSEREVILNQINQVAREKYEALKVKEAKEEKAIETTAGSAQQSTPKKS